MTLPVNPPPAPSAASASGGNLSAGAYLWAVTFVGNFGETGIGGQAGFTATAGQAGALTNIPTGPTGTVSRNVYRTAANGTTFQFVANIPDNTSTTFTDLLGDGSLGGAPSQFFLAQGQLQAAFIMFDDRRPIGTANYGDVNIGPGPWDGATTGFFAGSASGTALAMNMQSGFAGNLADLQVAGVSAFKVGPAGQISVGPAPTPITNIATYAAAVTPASVAANTTAEQTFTVTGLTTADKVFVNKPTAQAGLGIANVRVSAANTLAITYVNDTAGALTPTAETYQVVAIRS